MVISEKAPYFHKEGRESHQHRSMHCVATSAGPYIFPLHSQKYFLKTLKYVFTSIFGNATKHQITNSFLEIFFNST